MPTYVYETIPGPGQRTKRYEFQQRMSEAPLTAHPETGEPLRRAIVAPNVNTGAGGDELAPCANGSCVMPRAQAEQGGCGAGACGW